MELEEAKELLNKCKRTELQDHAFGDTEVTWTLAGYFVAEGYFGGGSANVHIEWEGKSYNYDLSHNAGALRNCGTLDGVERNDETGPDEYQEGVTMPGLTAEGVLEELTGNG